MRNKKLIAGVIAICVAASTLAGCGNKVSKENTVSTNQTKEDSIDDSKDDSGSSTVQISDIKAKYAAEETVEYADALYNLERDHIFTYDITEEFFDFEKDEYDCFAVYYDAALTNRADVEIISDYDTMKLTISPNLMFDYNEEGSIVDNGTWGTRSKFYLVQYVDIETGEEFEKPIVTVFTVKDELNAPTLTQGTCDNGFYELSWTEVEGADYYEVYEYWEGADSAFLEYTTEETVGSYENFETYLWHKERFAETYGGTEIDVNIQWRINNLLDIESSYFVVAKTNDGKCSGMSNECKVSDIGNQIPVSVSDDFVIEYEGDTVLALPAYIDVEMLDESTSKFLIQYSGATATLLDDGRIFIEASVMNLPFKMQVIEFSGMDFDSFMEESSLLKERTAELTSKSVTTDEDINIPYVPGNDDITSDDPVTDESEPETEDGSEPETGTTAEPESETEENNQENGGQEDVDISAQILDSVYANSAMSEWIAINLLAHNEEIPLGEFPESANTEYLTDAFYEAYHQNPLCGIIYSLEYDYSKDALVVTYVLDKEETEKMQEESLKKADEIVAEIIKEEMSDFEKENAINTYLCENAEYNNDIMEYINADGTISMEAVNQFAHSFTPYGILVENLGVCESYSEAFLLLCNAAGIEAIIETGKLSGVNHEWNRIKIDGNWCVMDVTNNDNELLPNAYFNLSDEVASALLIADKDALSDNVISQYAAGTMEYEYYTQNNLFTDSEKEASELLADLLADNTMAVIRVENGMDENTVLGIVQDAVNKAGIASGMYYYCNGLISIVVK